MVLTDILGSILQVAGALALFIFGMKMMSDYVQRAAGQEMRSFFVAMTANRFKGLLTGFTTTALLQSSSATTVLTVSLVNAGLLTVLESAGIMMGANVGTTVTGWLVSWAGYEVRLEHIALPMIALALPFYFNKRNTYKNLGGSFIGLALLFIGLNMLQEVLPDLRLYPEVHQYLLSIPYEGLGGRLLFVIVGVLITLVFQSSSAAMALTILLTYQGLPLEIGASMILGENIGTTITAELAALVGNTNARRSARIHTMFNIIGVSWMVLALPYFLNLLDGLTSWVVTNHQHQFSLAVFHSMFNVLNAMLCIGFVKQFTELSAKMIPMKTQGYRHQRSLNLKELGGGMYSVPELSLIQANRGTQKLGKTIKRLIVLTNRLIYEGDLSRIQILMNELRRLEDETDSMERELIHYLSQIPLDNASEQTAQRIQGLMEVAHSLESIADVCVELAENLYDRRLNKAYFSPDMRNSINNVADKVKESAALMLENLNASPEKIQLEKAHMLETQIDSLYHNYVKNFVSEAGNNDEHKVTSVIYFKDILYSYERISDLLFKVSITLHERDDLAEVSTGQKAE